MKIKSRMLENMSREIKYELDNFTQKEWLVMYRISGWDFQFHAEIRQANDEVFMILSPSYDPKSFERLNGPSGIVSDASSMIANHYLSKIVRRAKNGAH